MIGLAIASTLLGLLAQNKPTPPPEMALFDPLMGEWKGEVTLGASPTQQIKGLTTFRFERILDGLYVQLTLAQDLPGMGVVRGQTTYAWDAKEKKLRSYTFANGGMTDSSRPRLEVGALQKGRIEVDSEGLSPAYRQIFEVQPDGTLKYSFYMAMGADGELAEIGRGSLKRHR